jgi:hypothetical protein
MNRKLFYLLSHTFFAGSGFAACLIGAASGQTDRAIIAAIATVINGHMAAARLRQMFSPADVREIA